MRSGVDGETFDVELDGKVVEHILLELGGRVLCQYFEEPRLFREPRMSLEVVESLFRLGVARPCVIS